MMTPMRLKAFEEKPVVTLLSPGIVSKKIDFDNFTKEKIFQIAWRSYFRKISLRIWKVENLLSIKLKKYPNLRT